MLCCDTLIPDWRNLQKTEATQVIAAFIDTYHIPLALVFLTYELGILAPIMDSDDDLPDEEQEQAEQYYSRNDAENDG